MKKLLAKWGKRMSLMKRKKDEIPSINIIEPDEIVLKYMTTTKLRRATVSLVLQGGNFVTAVNLPSERSMYGIFLGNQEEDTKLVLNLITCIANEHGIEFIDNLQKGLEELKKE